VYAVVHSSELHDQVVKRSRPSIPPLRYLYFTTYFVSNCTT
jgi:hypothetical protein